MREESVEIKDTEKEEPPKKKFTFFQKVSLVWNILWLVFYVFYCVYFIASGLGNKIVNFVLLGITVAYFLLFVIIWIVLGRRGKRFTGAGKRIYKVLRKLLLLVNTALVGGTIINMGLSNQFIITLFSIFAIINIVLNILWLLIRPAIARRVSSTVTSIKKEAKDTVTGVKSLFSSFSKLGGKKAVTETESVEAEPIEVESVDVEPTEAEPIEESAASVSEEDTKEAQ